MKIESERGPKQIPCGTPQDLFLLSQKLLLKNTSTREVESNTSSKQELIVKKQII